ncbi:MAG: VPS10 domain-containing protein [Acidobacteriota bacterium]
MMKLIRFRFLLALAAALLPVFFCPLVSAANPAHWSPTGPDGGDARRFAFSPADPSRIYLGTTDSWIYVSSDGGSSWSRLARLGTRDDLVVDSLVVDRSDPKTLYAGVWSIDHNDGGIYISHDEGHAWTPAPDMRGQSVRALAQARSNPAVIVAGALSGVYRTTDRGLHWTEISPAGGAEIHEVESIAIDPYDPGIIYAGTWHLPWKTSDGGAHWISIHEGVIDDSDVFSMIVDPSRPSVMFLSACSGIYRTDNFGYEFRKVQGIPSTARRTRSLRMDPSDRNTVYAGTTEGLYKTTDGGDTWARMTDPDVIVNDVYVDPRNPKHVLLATDRSGILASEDAATGFQASNTGFSQRQVATLLVDDKSPSTMYAGVINDKSYGGVFVTTDLGRTWKQQSNGLHGVDVFLLAQSPSGTLLAGTSRGIFHWDGTTWTPSDAVAAPPDPPADPQPAAKSTRSRTRAHRARPAKKIAAPPAPLEGRVTLLQPIGDTWFAATAQGLFRSADQGATWTLLATPNAMNDPPAAGAWRTIAAEGQHIFIGRRDRIIASDDGGAAWQYVSFPAGLTALASLALTPDGTLWAGGREGVFGSKDQGRTWTPLKRLPVVAVNNLAWDASRNRLMVTCDVGTVIYAVDPRTESWTWWNAGWTVHSVASLSGRLAAASFFSGVVVQPAEEATTRPGAPVQDARR